VGERGKKESGAETPHKQKGRESTGERLSLAESYSWEQRAGMEYITAKAKKENKKTHRSIGDLKTKNRD
jgi:hypothetical protein